MSSSDSEDENVKKFAAAVDTSLFDNNFYKPKDEKEVVKDTKQKEELKSQRYLENDENIFHSELNVSENMKNFIGKKMSKIIEESIEFVNVTGPKLSRKKQKDCTVLLTGFNEHVKIDKLEEEILPQIKIPIKRRSLNDEINESYKIKKAAIDVTKIKDAHDTKIRHKVIEYKRAKDGKCHIV
ncbi:hypothetical protein PVAND_009663 [Polypedilum vanderplanki]|uniref:Uncharacterized protein n=1 Tax=Polypedilum vanderplanki TaxID=319348 RepID=A0A9J6CDJ9_POLVA|nr:hypothetical protein PVAND_009663 [Polypedilum vanderplanki]